MKIVLIGGMGFVGLVFLNELFLCGYLVMVLVCNLEKFFVKMGLMVMKVDVYDVV